MKIKQVTVAEAIIEAARLICEREEGLIFNYCEELGCCVGKKSIINEAACNELGIPLLKANYIGGSIVVFPGDLSIMEIKHGHSRFGEYALKAIQEYLLSKGLRVFIQGNDLMLADIEEKTAYKVGSYGSSWVGKMTETAVHLSINSDVDLIKRICLKPMQKIPGALSKHGITAEELYQVVYERCLNVQDK